VALADRGTGLRGAGADSTCAHILVGAQGAIVAKRPVGDSDDNAAVLVTGGRLADAGQRFTINGGLTLGRWDVDRDDHVGARPEIGPSCDVFESLCIFGGRIVTHLLFRRELWKARCEA